MKKFLLSLLTLFAASSAFAVTETLTVSDFGASGTSYSEYNYTSATTKVLYKAYTAVNSSTNFQFNTSKAGSGIYSSENPGNRVIKSITVNVIDNPTAGSDNNEITIYGSTENYTDKTASPAGTSLDDITTTATINFDPEENGYKYFYIKSKKGAVYISSIDIEYVDAADPRSYVTLSFPEKMYNASLGKNFESPVLTCDIEEARAYVVYESSDESVATVDKNGKVTILDDGATTISAYIPENNIEYYGNAASYDLVVKDPNAIETVLNTNFFGTTNSYVAYTKVDTQTQIEYTSVQYKNGGMQFNINRVGCGLAVTAISPNYIIASISIDFKIIGGGLNVFKQNAAFEKNDENTPIDLSAATQIGSTITGNTTIAVGAPAFALVPAASNAIVLNSITVTYAKKVADDGSVLFTCEAFKDYMVCKDDMVELSLPEDAPAINFTVTNKSIADIEDGIIYAYKHGNTTVKASWEAVPGKWMAGSAEFTIYVKYATLAEVIADAQDGTTGFVKTGQTYFGNFPVVVGADMGNYNYVTDGSAWALFYVDHNHGEGAVLDAGWSGVLKFQNGLLEFEKINHSDITDTTGEFEIKSYENLQAKDFESKINEVMILKNVKFAEETPGASGTVYIGNYNNQDLEFFNRFEFDAVSRGIYDVKCVVSYYKDRVQIYPIEYTLVAELPHVYTAKTSYKVEKDDFEVEEGNVVTCNILKFTANIFEDGEMLEIADQGDFTLYMNNVAIGTLDDIIYNLPYAENAVWTVRKDGIEPIAIENPWKDVLSATAKVVNPVYSVYTDKAEAGYGHVSASFNLEVEANFTEYFADFYFETEDGKQLYELEFDFDNGIENVNATAHLTWKNNKPFCEIHNLAVVDVNDLNFGAVNFGINVVPTFPFLMTPVEQPAGAAMRAPRAAEPVVSYVSATATPITHEHMENAKSEVSGVADVVVDGEAVVEFYNLQGVKVEGELAPGLYIRRQGNEATKVVVK